MFARSQSYPPGERWIARELFLLCAAWLLTVVGMPLLTLLHRSLHIEIPVAIWGPDDVRIGDRVIRLDGVYVLVDNTKLPIVAGVAEGAGCCITVEAGAMREVACAEVPVTGGVMRVHPIQVEMSDEVWAIDGVALDDDGWQRTVSRFAGLHAFERVAANPALIRSLRNSLGIGVITAFFAVLLALGFVLVLARRKIPGAPIFRMLAMLPLFAPTMLYGLSLVYLFGNKGVVTTGFFGKVSALAIDIGLYGPVGIVLAECAYCFPAAYLLLSAALLHTDARVYEAAKSLGVPGWRVLFTITLPGLRRAIGQAGLVCFTLAFTDFGAPKVVGGNFNVLAVDIYKHVVGQQDFSMGAAVAMLLLAPAESAFVIEQILARREHGGLTGQSVPFQPVRNWAADTVGFLFCGTIAVAILIVTFAAGVASLFKNWPYDLGFTWSNYDFEGVAGGAGVFWNSIYVAAWTAIAGTVIVFACAYLVEKCVVAQWLKRCVHVLSIVPLALPGLVVGIAYIFFFDTPQYSIPGTSIVLPNPLHGLYGGFAILIVANLAHFHTVSYLTAGTALRQLDPAFESVSAFMGRPFIRLSCA